MMRLPVMRIVNASRSLTPKYTRTLATGTAKPTSTSTSKAATGQGTGANNEGAGLGTGTRQQTYQNSDVKGNPVNPSAQAANKGQHATKHSQTTPVTGQQKPNPSAGTPDAVGASTTGGEQSINAETKPHHSNKHSNHASTNSHSTAGSHSKQTNASHNQQSHQANSSSQTSTGSDTLANASATAKKKAQEVSDRVKSLMHDAGTEIPEGNSFVVMGSAVLAALLFVMLNPDKRYIKRVYNVTEKPRIEALQHPTTH